MLLPLLLPLLLPAPSDGEQGRPPPERLRTEPREGRGGRKRAREADLRRAARTCGRTPGGSDLPETGSPGRRHRGWAAGGGRGMPRTELPGRKRAPCEAASGLGAGPEPGPQRQGARQSESEAGGLELGRRETSRGHRRTESRRRA